MNDDASAAALQHLLDAIFTTYHYDFRQYARVSLQRRLLAALAHFQCDSVERLTDRVVREPRAVLREFGTELPDDVEVRVWDSTAEVRYMVLPERPSGTEGMSDPELAALVTRDAMIGVTRVQAPALVR